MVPLRQRLERIIAEGAKLLQLRNTSISQPIHEYVLQICIHLRPLIDAIHHIGPRRNQCLDNLANLLLALESGLGNLQTPLPLQLCQAIHQIVHVIVLVHELWRARGIFGQLIGNELPHISVRLQQTVFHVIWNMLHPHDAHPLPCCGETSTGDIAGLARSRATAITPQPLIIVRVMHNACYDVPSIP